MTEEKIPVKKDANELAEDRTSLAYERTALANDRTLMAWIRTSTSLTSFGFTIYKFFQEFRKAEGPELPHTLLSAREIGMVLIVFGFLGLFFALLQYRNDMNRIRSSYKVPGFNFTPVLAMLMLIFSLLLFFAALLRQ